MLRRKQHPSIFIALLSFGILVGVALAVIPNSYYLSGLGWITFVIFLIIICFWRQSTWLLGLVMIAGVLLGLARAVPAQNQMRQYQSLLGQTVIIKGKVVEDVATGVRGEDQIKLTNVTINEKKLSGLIWISTDTKMDIKRSFELQAKGKIGKGFGNFSASMYRANIITATDTHTDKAREIRDQFASNIRQVIDEPQASLGIGYLVGQKSTLPQSLQQALQIVGLTHIVVASGYNLTILVRFARRLFSPISKYLATVASGSMIGGFILITGFSPSMTRAGLVAGISLATWYYGRSIHPLVLLPFVAALTVLVNPSYMWGDLGWYLSFAAFAGVMILAPLLQNYFFGHKKPGTIRQIFGETISAQLLTMPIIALSFGTIALFALPANLLVLPFVPLAMILVFVCGITYMLIPGLAALFGSITQMLLNYMTNVIELFVSFPNASIEVQFTVGALVVSYLVIIIVAIMLQRITKHDFRNDNIIE